MTAPVSPALDSAAPERAGAAAVEPAVRAAALAVPHVSVVLASTGSREALETCLGALLGQTERAHAELIVARERGEVSLDALGEAFPTIRVVEVPEGSTLAQVRESGMRAATGDIVMLTEDHRVPGPSWVEELCHGVDNVPDRADASHGELPTDWTAYFTAQRPSADGGPVLGQAAPSGGSDRLLASDAAAGQHLAQARERVRDGVMNVDRPYLSVVVPVRNGNDVLPHMLEALEASDIPRASLELIVVDDGSTDDSAWVASRHADLVIRLPGPSRGPGYARNRGAERARGDLIVFMDADCLPRTDTLRRVAVAMASRQDLDGIFGAYCDEPAAAGLVSQYRNLLHHYTHDQEPGEAQTFWAGCGCIRRTVFLDVGMYDEWRFSRPQIEDVELGYRLSRRRHRILLQPEIQVTHLKRWTFFSMLKADFMDRGVPWARLLAEQSALLGKSTAQTRTLSLRTKEKNNTFFVCLGLMLLVLAPTTVAYRTHLVVAGLGCLLLVVFRGLPLYRFFARKRGLGFALSAIVLHFIYYVTAAVSVVWGALLTGLVGEPRPDPSVEAFSELNLNSWPPVPKNPSKIAAAGAASSPR